MHQFNLSFKSIGFLLAITVFLKVPTCAQSIQYPGKNKVEHKWIRNDAYTMKWFMLRDTQRIEMANVQTEIRLQNKQLLVVTQVQMRGMKNNWIDSTLADATTLKPIYHASYNMQRDMVIHFGDIITGVYQDKMKKTTTQIRDNVQEAYFDSNLYPVLTGWMPLQTGYTTAFQLFDFNPKSKTGLLKAYITDVQAGSFHSEKEGIRSVWLVKVRDEIGGGENGQSVYYFDQQDRRLWKQEIEAGGRKMEMHRQE